MIRGLRKSIGKLALDFLLRKMLSSFSTLTSALQLSSRAAVAAGLAVAIAQLSRLQFPLLELLIPAIVLEIQRLKKL